MLDTSDPGARKKPRHFVFDDLMRFPDLRHKPIRPRELVIGDARQVFIKHADGTLEQVSFGDPEGSSEVRAVDACLGQPIAEVASCETKLPAFVIAGIAEAPSADERRKGVIAEPLLPFGEKHPVFLLPMIVDEDGVINPGALFTEPDGHLRMRRGCFVGLFEADKEIRKAVIIEGAQFGYQPLVKEVASTEIADIAAQIDWLTHAMFGGLMARPLVSARRTHL